jgi:hypothetical protein
MPAAFDYGNLLTAQAGRGNYQVQRQGANAAQAALGNTQNWAGLAAASAQGRAAETAAIIESNARTTQQGIGSYGNLASSIVSAYGGIAQQGISGKASVETAKKAIEQEKARRGGPLGAIAGMAVGAAGLFIE